jgi:polysaccharide pyruvyl transferase WcaK-like protein
MNPVNSAGSIRTVTLLGSSSGRNAGDAALMAAIQASVNATCGRTLRFEIPTICPSYVRNNYPEGAVPVGMLPWNLSVKMLGLPTWRSVCRADISLIFDAILFDRALYNPLFNFLSTLRLLLPAAKRRGKRIACYNVGTGPVTTAAGRRMLRELMEVMDFITVRDSDSRDLLLEIGVKNPRLLVTADAAINAPACDDARADAILRAAGADPAAGAPLLAVNINRYLDSWAGTGREPLTRDRFLGIHAEALDRIGEATGARMVFVCTQHADVSITRELMGRLKKVRPAGLVTNVEHNHVEVKGVLRRVDLLFGMRLHAMILGSSEGTPVCGLAYQPKVHHYYTRIGLRERSLGFEDFSVDAVTAHVTKAWNDRAALRAHLARVMPDLRSDAHTPAALVAALDRGEDLDAAFARLAGPNPLANGVAAG